MTVWRAIWPAIGLVIVAAGGRIAAEQPAGAARPAEADVRLIAGEPLVLVHPPINKSIGNAVHCLALSPDGSTLVTGADAGVYVWNTADGKRRLSLQSDGRGVDSLSIDPRGEILVAGGASGVIQIWDARTFKPLRTLKPEAGAIRGLAISADGRRLAAAGPDGGLGAADKRFGILLWDATTGVELPAVAHPSPAFGTTALAFLPDGRRLVTAQDRTLRFIAVDDPSDVRKVDLPELPQTLGSIAVAGDRLVTGAYEPKLRLFDAGNGKPLRDWAAHDREPPPRRGVSAVGMSQDGRYVASGGMDGLVSVWEAATGRRLLELDGRGEASGRWVTGVGFSADGRLLAASHFGGTAALWRITPVE
jgi:WD40 repeat protein